MITFYVHQDAIDRQLYVLRHDAAGIATVSGPWHESAVAWRQCENAAHRAARATAGSAIYTVMPDEVQRAVAARTGETRGGRAAWIVRRQP